MNEFKEKFAMNCEEIRLLRHGLKPFYLTTPEPGWDASLIIGPYKDLCTLAKQIRGNLALQNDLAEIGARLGARHDDRACLGDKQQKLPGLPAKGDYRSKLEKALEVMWGHARRGDLDSKWKEAQATKTVQAHHLVEQNIVERLGCDTGLLTEANAPAVLVVQELHLSYLTPNIPAAVRERFTRRTTTQEAAEKIEQLFLGAAQEDGTREGGLYTRPGLFSLIEPTAGVIREIERSMPRRMKFSRSGD